MTNIHKAAREALPHFEEALDSALEQLQEATIKYAGYKQDKIAAMEREYQAGRAALATLRAALSEAPGEEREAFEAWWAGLCPAPYYPGIEKEIARNAWQARAMLAARPEAPTVAPLTWYEGAPPFPQNQEWFIAETIHGDRVVLRSLDDGREHKLTYDFKTADETYMAKRIIARWMQFPDCEFLPPSAPTVALTEEQIGEMLAELDQIASDYDSYDYGLPTHDIKTMANLRAAVRAMLETGKEGGA